MCSQLGSCGSCALCIALIASIIRNVNNLAPRTREGNRCCDFPAQLLYHAGGRRISSTDQFGAAPSPSFPLSFLWQISEQQFARDSTSPNLICLSQTWESSSIRYAVSRTRGREKRFRKAVQRISARHGVAFLFYLPTNSVVIMTTNSHCPAAFGLALPLTHHHRSLPRTTPRRARQCFVRAEMVRVSVPLQVEAPRDHCYDLFSDLSKMSEWSSTLQAVDRDPQDPTFSNWSFSWNGIRLSWRARDDDPLEADETDSAIRWRSVSGLEHIGSVEFMDICDRTTRMVMTVDYDIASLLAAIMQSSFVSNFVESAIESDLQRFRMYALRTYRRKKIQTRRAAREVP